MIQLVSPIAAYLRASSDQQEDSHERQENIIRRFLLDNSLTVADWFTDFRARDEAGRAKDFNSLLSKIKRGQIKTVIVSNLDRWGTADVDEFFKFRSILLEHGCKLWSVEDGDLTSKEQLQLLTIIIKAEQSREYVRRMSKNIASGKHRNATAGNWNGGKSSPYGYDRLCVDARGKPQWLVHYETPNRRLQWMADPDGNIDFSRPPTVYEGKGARTAKNKTDDIWLVPSRTEYGNYQCIDGDRTEVVRLMYSLLIDKPWSLKKTARHMTELGLTFYSHHITPQLLQKLIPNEKYKGDMVWNKTQRSKYAVCVKGQVKEIEPIRNKNGKLKTLHKLPEEWEIVPGRHVGLVSAETWEEANRWMQEKCRKLRPRSNAFYLKPLLVCGHCGKPMSARMQHRKGKGGVTVRYPGYYCMSFKDKHRFELKVQHWIPHDEVEKWLLAKLDEIGVQVNLATEINAILDLQAQYSSQESDLRAFFCKGLDAYVAEVRAFYTGHDYPDTDLRNIVGTALRHPEWNFKDKCLHEIYDEVKVHVHAIDAAKVSAAKTLLAQKEEEHRTAVQGYLRLKDEDAQAIALEDIATLKREKDSLQEETVPFSLRYADKVRDLENFKERIKRLVRSLKDADAESRAQLLGERIEKITLFFVPYRPRGSGNRLDEGNCEIKFRNTSDTNEPSS